MNFLNFYKFLLFIIFTLLFPVSSFSKANFNEIVQQVSKEAEEKGISRKVINEFKNKMLKNIPLGRVAKESDVATAVAFLAADSSEMITGTSLLVDGGWTAI